MSTSHGKTQRFLTPMDFYAKAEHFGIDLAREPFLLGLLKQALETPLPPHWIEEEGFNSRPMTHTSQEALWSYFDKSCQVNNQKSIQYRNEVTHVVQKDHPADSYFRSQIEKQREKYQQGQQGEDDTEQLDGWLAFEELEEQEEEQEVDQVHQRRVYYYDFVTGTRQEEHPIAILRDQKPLQVADPSIFQNAATLHHQQKKNSTTTTPPYKNLQELEILCFTSWWTESRLLEKSQKKHVHIYFSIPTKHFQIVLQETQHVFTISHLMGSNGQVLEAYDLYLGARIPLLGRLTTLKQASMLTQQWLEYHQKHLTKWKEELEKELSKYELSSSSSLSTRLSSRQEDKEQERGGGGQLVKHRGGLEEGQKNIHCVPTRTLSTNPQKNRSFNVHSIQVCSLRQMNNQVEELKRRLAKYRPDLVRRIAQQMGR